MPVFCRDIQHNWNIFLLMMLSFTTCEGFWRENYTIPTLQQGAELFTEEDKDVPNSGSKNYICIICILSCGDMKVCSYKELFWVNTDPGTLVMCERHRLRQRDCVHLQLLYAAGRVKQAQYVMKQE